MSQSDFLEFYNAHLGLNEGDKTLFELSINQPLLSTFRLTPTHCKERIREKISKFSFVQQVPFLTDVFSFELKNKHPDYKEFIEFLVSQTDIGNVQRQEIVSFLPHLFMSLEENHFVLETCASPGSKTKNLLETIKTGLLVSNDKTMSRVNILITESSKKATTNFVVTQNDAMNFPTFSCKFDRICCDVPCSGDGTYRKNLSIIPKWSVKNAIALSNMQLRILKRALDALKEDGILVYSTCSLNPIENEWVINAAIGNAEGYELLNDFDFIQYESIEKEKITVRKGITSFTYDTAMYNNEEMAKCYRILPHDQNTGGFFIAVIKKKTKIVESISELPQKLNNTFVELDSTAIEKINITCDVSNCKSRFISFNNKFKNVFAVSDLCYDFLCHNPKLKIVYAGLKAFTESDLRKEVYRPKSAFLQSQNIKSLIELTFSDFTKLITNKTVLLSDLDTKPEGLFSADIEGLPYKICGFSGGNKVFLYIDDNHRKAYAQLYIK